MISCVYCSACVPDEQLRTLRAMISNRVLLTVRSSVRCWRQRAVLTAALEAVSVRSCRSYSAPTRRGVSSDMEELLARVVVPLPSYETRDKSPPPPESLSLEFVHYYRSLEKEEKIDVLTKLSQEYGVDHKTVSELSAKLLDIQLRDLATVLQAEDRLRYSLTPCYKQFFSHVSRVEGGVKFLVDIRADVLEMMALKSSESPHIRVKRLFIFMYGCLHGSNIVIRAYAALNRRDSSAVCVSTG